MKAKRKKILQLLEQAEYEVALFKKSRQFPHFSQACEKTWVAFVLMLELKSGKEITGRVRPRPIAKALGYEHLYALCNALHILHYEGSPELNFRETFEDVGRAAAWIREEVAS